MTTKLIKTRESKAPSPKTYHLQQVGKRLGCFTLSPWDEVPAKYLSLVLQSGFLKNEYPLSTVFISQAGIGKSRLIATLKNEKYVYNVTDITPKLIVNEFLEDAKRGKYKYIVIGDFTNVTDSHSERTGSTIVSLLRNLTAEGVGNIKDYGMEFTTEQEIHAGLITGTTISSYNEFTTSWKKTGFLSRLLPFSFTHSPQTKESILDNIDRDEDEKLGRLPYRINRRPPNVEANPELLKQLRGYSEILALYTNSMPYRAQIQLRRLVKSNAVLRGDDRICQVDIDEVTKLCNWLNYNFEAI